MVTDSDLAEVERLMREFADRTGLESAADSPRRYLWTDAFAVCNYISLFGATGEQGWRDLAVRLVDQVHVTLGQHRPDDPRRGWISGLDEQSARRHPTSGGLRIGKRLGERPAGQAPDEREEWDRDGQYLHYLTKWMHALSRLAIVTDDPDYCRYAIELAQKAHAAFSYKVSGTDARRLYWKMSIDLTRPLVPSMGQHDPLDALLTYGMLDSCRAAYFAAADLPGLEREIAESAQICRARSWVTDDPLGLGGLLVDALRTAELQGQGIGLGDLSTERLLTDASIGLAHFAGSYPLHAGAGQRLAFRELGLAIGMHAVGMLRQRVADGRISLTTGASRALESLARLEPLAERIEAFWRAPANQSPRSWRVHLDINSVMLASSLLPDQILRSD